MSEPCSPKDCSQVTGRTRANWAQNALLLSLVTGMAFLIRLLVHLRSPHPLGTDGYYYVVQITDLLQHGRLHVPDSSWVFALLAGLHALIPNPVLALKVGACLLAAACVPAAWLAGRQLAGSNPEPGSSNSPCAHEGSGPAWALAFALAASPSLSLLSSEFVKNLALVPPALFAIALLARPKQGLWVWALAGVCALAAALAHRLGAGLGLLAATGAALGWLLGPRRADRGGINWLAVGVLSTAGLGVLLASLILPGVLHPADLERLSGQFDFSPGWPPPFCWFDLRTFHPAQQVELGLPWLALGLGVWAWFTKPTRRIALGALLLPLLVCLFPFWRRDVLDMGYRLGLMAPLLASPLLVVAWPKGLRATHRFAFPVLIGIGLCLVPIARFGPQPSDQPPYESYRALIDKLPRPVLLIAQQGFNFYYDHVTGHEAMAWAPESVLDRRQVYRLAWGIHDGEWLTCPAPDAPPVTRLNADYVYVREDVWETMTSCARDLSDLEWLERISDRRNPNSVRPASLLRNRNKNREKPDR